MQYNIMPELWVRRLHLAVRPGGATTHLSLKQLTRDEVLEILTNNSWVSFIGNKLIERLVSEYLGVDLATSHQERNWRFYVEPDTPWILCQYWRPGRKQFPPNGQLELRRQDRVFFWLMTCQGIEEPPEEEETENVSK